MARVLLLELPLTGPIRLKAVCFVTLCNTVFREFAKDIGKHITPHTMRHTFGTIVYEDTGDLYLTAEAMGHKNIKNTMIYAKKVDYYLKSRE